MLRGNRVTKSEDRQGLLFWKKEAKNFWLFWLRLFRMGSAQMNKSFLVLFFKKYPDSVIGRI
jgi:hypothetical protein